MVTPWEVIKQMGRGLGKVIAIVTAVGLANTLCYSIGWVGSHWLPLNFYAYTSATEAPPYTDWGNTPHIVNNWSQVWTSEYIWGGAILFFLFILGLCFLFVAGFSLYMLGEPKASKRHKSTSSLSYQAVP